MPLDKNVRLRLNRGSLFPHLFVLSQKYLGDSFMRFVQSIIDILRHKKILEIKIVNNPIFQWQKLTKKQIKKLQNKLKTDKKLKVAL